MTKETITYDDFAKLDLRTAKIKNAEEIEGADKLYNLTLELGSKKTHNSRRNKTILH